MVLPAEELIQWKKNKLKKCKRQRPGAQLPQSNNIAPDWLFPLENTAGKSTEA